MVVDYAIHSVRTLAEGVPTRRTCATRTFKEINGLNIHLIMDFLEVRL